MAKPISSLLNYNPEVELEVSNIRYFDNKYIGKSDGTVNEIIKLLNIYNQQYLFIRILYHYWQLLFIFIMGQYRVNTMFDNCFG